MDNHNQPSLSAESQQFYHHFQPPSTIPIPPSTIPSPYDASYYASSYQQHYNQIPQQQQQLQQPDYSSYYYPDYSNSFQSQPQLDPISILPPGVAAISAEPRQTLVQNHPDVYYAHVFPNPQQQPSQNGYMPPSHSAFAARGGHGGRPIRGGRRGSSRGRGRGGARVVSSANQTPLGIPWRMHQQSSSGTGQAAASSAANQLAWCELCKADCNTPEILEQHKNGKKHKRNLKVYEEMQSLNKVNDSKLDAVVVQPKTKEGGSAVISEAVVSVNTAENPADKANSSGARGGGLKRKMRGGRGGKLMRGNDGSRKAVEPTKPKQIAILFCELCNVKCESQVVWDSHIAGKKHLSNAKRFPGHQSAMGRGPRGLQSLYPPLPTPNIVSSTPLTTQEDQHRLPESQPLNQQGGVQDPQASQAALMQLLNQHGIHDAQSLLTQLTPFLLTQPGVPASGALGNVAEPVTQDQPDSSTQVAQILSGENEGKFETVVDESIPKAETNGTTPERNIVI